MNKKEIRYALSVVLAAAENARCNSLHHTKGSYHTGSEVCKQEREIHTQASLLREYMKEQGL